MASQSWTPPPASSFYVHSVPSLADSESLLLYAGYLPARGPASQPKDDAHLYFLLEKARHLGGRKRRLLLWLNGGPGCSSFDGVMMEIGSFRPSRSIQGQMEWTVPGGAWNEYTDVLFLDQPVGTGFSYANTNGYASTLEVAAQDVNFFLKRFVEVFPEYGKGSGTEFWIAGESYAGQYIPFTADEIIRDRSASVDLKGIAIGNGAIDTFSQAGSELDLLLEKGLWKETDQATKEMRVKVQKCEEAKAKLPKGSHPQEIPACEHLLRNIIDLTYTKNGNDAGRCINIYDVRLTDTHPACGMNWPPTLSATYDYLAREDVREAFHVSKSKHPEAWIECSNRVGSRLKTQKESASFTLIPGLLSHGLKVLLFAGDQDLICNHIGVERVVDNLQWGGVQGWGDASASPTLAWTVNGSPAGTFRSARNLTYVSVFGASHMVGFDVPIAAHDMMLRFMEVDLLDAAGPSAMIPSTLEGEKDRKVIIGDSSKAPSVPLPPPAQAPSTLTPTPFPDGKTEEEVASEAKWAAYYNAGTAALIVLLILVAVGTFLLLRIRRNNRRRGGRRRGVGGTLWGSASSGGDINLSNANGDEVDDIDDDDVDGRPLTPGKKRTRFGKAEYRRVARQSEEEQYGDYAYEDDDDIAERNGNGGDMELQRFVEQGQGGGLNGPGSASAGGTPTTTTGRRINDSLAGTSQRGGSSSSGGNATAGGGRGGGTGAEEALFDIGEDED